MMSHFFIGWLDSDGVPKPAPICWPQSAVKMPAAEAVLAVLFLAAASDGVSKPAESAALQALTRRWSVRPTLRDKNMTALNYAALKWMSGERALENACAAIPETLRPAVFANAIEICLIDGDLKRQEAEFLDTLAEALGMPDEDAKRIAEVVALKLSC